MNSRDWYILYIYVSTDEVIKMAIAELNNIDNKLVQMYANQTTTNVNGDYQERSNILLDQMQMIAFNNKMFLKLK